jgi:hypothetical protein
MKCAVKGRLVWVVAGLVLAACWALAAPDWQTPSDYPPREEWVYRDAAGDRLTASTIRSYISGADSSAASNQLNWTFAAACSCYYAYPERSGSYDTYRISGSDSLLVDNAWLHGKHEAKGSIDDTTIVATGLPGTVIQTKTLPASALEDFSITAGKIGVGQVQSYHLGNNIEVGGTLDVGGEATFYDWLTAADFQLPEISPTVPSMFADPDSGYAHAGWWFNHRLKVGAGAALDRLTVDGGLNVSGVSALHGTGITGSLTVSTKAAVTDSVSAYKSLIAGTPSQTGSLVLRASDGKKLTITPPTGMAADRAFTALSFAVVDTFKLNTKRTLCGDRKGSKYVAGVLATDLAVGGAGFMDNGGASLWGCDWYCKADSVGFVWDVSLDNETTSFIIIRR